MSILRSRFLNEWSQKSSLRAPPTCFSNQNMFSLSVFQSHCVVVVKLDFFSEAPNYNCRAVLWQKSTVVYAQKCANLCTPVFVCSTAVDAHVLLRSAHLSVLSCSRAPELSMQRCYICLIRSAEMGHNNENSSQSLCSNNSVNSFIINFEWSYKHPSPKLRTSTYFFLQFLPDMKDIFCLNIQVLHSNF